MSDEPKNKGGRPRKNFDWPIAESKKQAAEILGWPVSVVTQCQKAGCPGFAHGRVSIGEVIPWLGKRGLDDAEVDWARELKKEQAVEKRDGRLVRDGLLVSKPEIREGLTRIQTLVFDSLEKIFCQELPPDLHGLDGPAIARRCVAAIDALRDELRAKFQAMADVPAASSDSSAMASPDGSASNASEA